MHKLNFERYPRTIYSIPNRDKIKAYLEATREKRLNGRLSPAEIIEDDRFTSKQGEPFLLMETYNVDVEL